MKGIDFMNIFEHSNLTSRILLKFGIHKSGDVENRLNEDASASFFFLLPKETKNKYIECTAMTKIKQFQFILFLFV